MRWYNILLTLLLIGCQTRTTPTTSYSFEASSVWPLDSHVLWMDAQSHTALEHKDWGSFIQHASSYRFPYKDIMLVHAYHNMRDIPQELTAMYHLVEGGWMRTRDAIVMLSRHSTDTLSQHVHEPWVQIAYINRMYAPSAWGSAMQNACQDGNTLACQMHTDHKLQRIALLLPMKGQLADSAKAFRQGFMAAVMRDNDSPVDVETLDTSSDTIDVIVQKIHAYKPDWIVGPMEKKVIKSLMQKKLSYPTMILGECESSMSHVYCFPVAATGEVPLIVSRLQASGVESVWLVNDKGDWYQRWGTLFEETWRSRGQIQVDYVQDYAQWKKSMYGAKQDTEGQRFNSHAVVAQKRPHQAIILNMPVQKIKEVKGSIDYNWLNDAAIMAPSLGGKTLSMMRVGYCDSPLMVGATNGRLPRAWLDLVPTLSSGSLMQHKRFIAWGVDAYGYIRRGERVLNAPTHMPYEGALGISYVHDHKIIRLLECGLHRGLTYDH